MKKITLLFFTVLLVLQGCIPVIFVAGAATAAVVYDQRSSKTIFDDKHITFAVQRDLDNDPELKGKSHLSVTSFNRVVLLVGQVSTASLKARAEKIVKSNSKVKMLYNEVTVGNSISNVQKTNDSWITTKVKTVLTTTPGLNSGSIKIVTENGVVYLMGLTTRTQAKIAADKTRTVAGVEKVVKIFEYVG